MNLTPSQPLELPGGLILRCAAPADAERLAEFDCRIHLSDPAKPEPNPYIAAWVRDLFSGKHPRFKPQDFTIVEDPASGKIISSLNLIDQTWSYAGIPFEVGRPELVGTDPQYRGRGLVRHQFEVAHAWSRERGQLVQVITGIPYYYRLFGYEMAVNLGGGRIIYKTHLETLKEDESEPCSIRPALEADIPHLQACYALMCARGPLACLRTPADWRHELRDKSPENVNRVEFFVIEDNQGSPIGMLGIPPLLWDGRLSAVIYELTPGHSYLEVTPALIRFLFAHGAGMHGEDGSPFKDMAGLALGESHPAYSVLRELNAPNYPPYAYYVRVPDLPAFLRHIAPALEGRLAESACAGHSKTLEISFYRGGLRIVLEKGRIQAVEDLQSSPDQWDQVDACFPALTFLQLVFQHRGIEELRRSYPDVWVKNETRVLLNALFPRQPSDIWPLS